MIDAMGLALTKTKKLTVAEFLEWEGEPNERYELIDGEIVAMGSGRLDHALVIGNLAGLLYMHLRSTKCRVFSESMLVAIDETTVFVPDVFVTCKRIQPGTSKVSDPPLLVFEVLSPSTQLKDRGTKLAGYCGLDSVWQYVIVDPLERTVESHTRLAGGKWAFVDHTASGYLPLPAIDLEVPLPSVFHQLDPT